MAKVKFTDAFVRNLKPPQEGRTEITDASFPGLRIRVTPAGKKSWLYEKRVKGGKKRKHDLGQYPATSIKSAREQALEIQVEANKGIDRVLLKKERKQQEEKESRLAISLKDALAMYYELHCVNISTGAERMTSLRQALQPYLGDPAKEITNEILQSAIDAKARSGAKVQANRLRAYFSHFSSFARARGHFTPGVGTDLQKAVKETPREREPSLKEVRAIYNASFALGDLWGPFLRLLILTAQREDEIAALRWSEVDFSSARLTIRGARTKNSSAHITHLSQPAICELEWLHAWADEDADFVFTTTGTTPVSGFSKMKKRLDKQLGGNVAPWRFHDLRTAFATAMSDAGHPEGVVDRVLNHVATSSAPSAVARVYNRAKLLDQRKVVLDEWARLVTRLD